MAPIVPYAGENIKKQWNDTIYEDIIPNEEEDFTYTNKFLDLMDKYSSYNDLCKELLNRNAYLIVSNTELTIYDDKPIPTGSSYVGNNISPYIDQCILIETDNASDFEVKAYYFFSYLGAYHMDREVVRQYLKSITGMGQARDTALEEFMDSLYSASYMEEDEETSALNDQMDVLSHHQRSQIQKILNEFPDDDDSTIFDMNSLLSYLYNNPHMICNEYGNSLFLTNAAGIIDLSDISYFEGQILCCNLSDRYMIIPFLDASKDYSLRLLCTDAEGRVYVQDDFDFTI